MENFVTRLELQKKIHGAYANNSSLSELELAVCFLEYIHNSGTNEQKRVAEEVHTALCHLRNKK